MDYLKLRVDRAISQKKKKKKELIELQNKSLVLIGYGSPPFGFSKSIYGCKTCYIL